MADSAGIMNEGSPRSAVESDLRHALLHQLTSFSSSAPGSKINRIEDSWATDLDRSSA